MTAGTVDFSGISTLDLGISGSSAGDLLYYDGTSWTNLNFGGVQAGNLMYYDGSGWDYLNFGGASDGDFITWDGTNSQLTSMSGIALDDLSDVDLAGASDGDALVWDGSKLKWVPESQLSPAPFKTLSEDLAETVEEQQLIIEAQQQELANLKIQNEIITELNKRLEKVESMLSVKALTTKDNK